MQAPRFKRLDASFSMLGWGLNEEQNIGDYIDKAHRFLASISDDYELIIIDDGSTDSTWQIAAEYQKTRHWLRIYKNGVNRGVSYSAKRAFGLAQKDYLFWQTIDWAYDISNLRDNIHLLDCYDVLQGVRESQTFSQRFFRRSDNLYKALISNVNYWLIRFLFQLPLSDFQNVTIYPRRLVQSFDLETNSSFTNPELLLKAWWSGASIKEIPTPFMRRRKGKAKGTRLRSVLSSVRDVFYWWFRWIVLNKRAQKGRGHIAYADEPIPAIETVQS